MYTHWEFVEEHDHSLLIVPDKGIYNIHVLLLQIKIKKLYFDLKKKNFNIINILKTINNFHFQFF